jgi:hypothetical protein
MVTAAVKGMSVAQMRKLLSEMRSKLHTQTLVMPFLADDTLSNGQKMYEFAIDVTLGIHEKRSKTKKLMQAKLES